MSGPTTMTESSNDANDWHASAAMAFAMRAVAVATPILVAWLVVRALSRSFFQPEGWFGVALWLAQAIVVGCVVSSTAERFTRRLVPLAALFSMSLAFPDKAPSRFGLALRAGTVTKLQRHHLEVDGAIQGTVTEAAAAAVELVGLLGRHDRSTRGHTERVRAYSDLIAEELGLAAPDRQRLAWGALLHDLGKLRVPPEILNKQGAPSAEEWMVLRGHPGAAQELLEPLNEWLGEWVRAAAEHHERWDGAGYPKGLAGEEISLAGRIVAVADAYDVMTSRRSYKAPISPERARAELVACAGTHFDPDVIRAFLNASLGRRRGFGALAVLAELPQLARVWAGLASIGPAVAGGVAAVGVLTVGLDPRPAPQALPFASPVVVSTSTTPIVLSTTRTTPMLGAVDTTSLGGDEPVMDESTSSSEVPDSATSPSTVTRPEPSPSSTDTIAPSLTIAPPTTLVPTTTLAPSTAAGQTTTLPSTTSQSGPFVVDDTAEVDDNKNVKIYVLDNDVASGAPLDPTSLEVIVDPLQAQVFHVQGGYLHYKSSKNYDGIDSLVYRVCDTSGLCGTAIVTITING